MIVFAFVDKTSTAVAADSTAEKHYADDEKKNGERYADAKDDNELFLELDEFVDEFVFDAEDE